MINKYIFFISLILTFSLTSCFSQSINYSVSSIPDSLLENANVVVRYSENYISLVNHKKAEFYVKEVITILNKSGTHYANLTILYNSFKNPEIKSYKIYDKYGNLIKKIGKSEIMDIAAFDGYSLYSDYRYQYIKSPIISPPYTVEYEYVVTANSLLYIPDWKPCPGYNVSIENAVLKIKSNENSKYRTKLINDEFFKISEFSDDEGKTIKKVEINNLLALENEPFNDLYDAYFPVVYIQPVDFEFDDLLGNSDSWVNYGNWKGKLLKGLDVLPDETVAEVIEIIKDKHSKVERIQAVYKYMQSKTRYVCITEGVGSLKPFSAQIVDKNGYGDCKALSNYMKSLLNSVGITSYYASVYGGNSHPVFMVDFPSHQSNHVILCVPLYEDTLWLECTDQTIPFGYLGTFTDDRKALIIDSEGKGKIAHTTVYPEEVNVQSRYANINLNANGYISIECKTEYRGLQYENVHDLLRIPEEDKEIKLNERIAIPGMKLLSFSFVEQKDRIPIIFETIHMNVKSYASVSSNRLFLVANIFNRFEDVPPKLKNRKTNIRFRRGYTDIDSIVYKIPDLYSIEYLPDNIFEKNKFGSYKVSYSVNDSLLIYTRRCIMHKGEYPPESYNELRKFLNIIYKKDKESVVFVKN